MYPEHDKIKALEGKNQVVGEFLEWLEGRFVIAKYHKHSDGCRDDFKRLWCGYTEDTLEPLRINADKLLAEYFDINHTALMAEKDEMLREIRHTDNL